MSCATTERVSSSVASRERYVIAIKKKCCLHFCCVGSCLVDRRVLRGKSHGKCEDCLYPTPPPSPLIFFVLVYSPTPLNAYTFRLRPASVCVTLPETFVMLYGRLNNTCHSHNQTVHLFSYFQNLVELSSLPLPIPSWTPHPPCRG